MHITFLPLWDIAILLLPSLYFLMWTYPPTLLDKTIGMGLFQCNWTPEGHGTPIKAISCPPLATKEWMHDTNHSKKILFHNFSRKYWDRKSTLLLILNIKVYTFKRASGFSYGPILVHQDWELNQIFWSRQIWWCLKPDHWQESSCERTNISHFFLLRFELAFWHYQMWVRSLTVPGSSSRSQKLMLDSQAREVD